MSSRGANGPCFFEDGGGDTQTVNAQRYWTVLAKLWRALKTKLKNDPKALQCQWFQQDGFTVHAAQETRDWLRERLRERVMSKFETCPWPFRSSDLTPSDFFLRRVTSSAKYTEPTQEASKTARSRWNQWCLARRLPCAALRQVKLCLERNGSHREHVLGATQVSGPWRWICPNSKYRWTGLHLVADSWLYHHN